MVSLVFGLLTASLWAATLLGSSRSSRIIGAWSTLAWVMLVGIVVAVPLVVVTGPMPDLSGEALRNLVVAGLANTGGLLLIYGALQRGKVALVGPIASTEGAIAAVFAIVAGDPVTAAAAALLALIAIGVVLAAVESPGDVPARPAPTRVTSRATATTIGLALGGALLFGVNLYTTSRIASELPIAWAVLPARLAGVIGVAVPLILLRRLRITRQAVPLVLLVGLAEVGGTATFAIGARESAAVTSVIASQFAGIAAIVAFLLFGERLGRVQLAGVVIIAVGVASLAALQA
jgi:drug/metabolite transporter (DMT)-like permease